MEALGHPPVQVIWVLMEIQSVGILTMMQLVELVGIWVLTHLAQEADEGIGK